MSKEEKIKYVGSCTHCKKDIKGTQYREYFNGYGMHEMFCSTRCSNLEREKKPIDHQAWK